MQARPVWRNRFEKGIVLEDLTEAVLQDLSVSYRRNRVNGQGPDFYVSFCRKRQAIENKHWSCQTYGLSCIKKEVVGRFKGIRGYHRTVISSNLSIKLREARKIESALSEAKISVKRLGFEIVDNKTWRRAYRIIRRLIIRLIGLERFLQRSRAIKTSFLELAKMLTELVLPGDDVKWS
jgi:hypothetical protein